MTDTNCVIVCTTLPVDADSMMFGRTLVQERLAACVTSHSGLRSIYRWGDGIELNEEQGLVIKTTQDRVEALGTRVRELHPYEVPEFVVVPVIDGEDDYLAWIRESTSASVRD